MFVSAALFAAMSAPEADEAIVAAKLVALAGETADFKYMRGKTMFRLSQTENFLEELFSVKLTAI